MKLSFKKIEEHFSHDIRKIFANKFIIVSSLLALYFIFATWHFGLKDGFLVMALTWSFFVLATPIPDGGIILDLPMRYFAGIKMLTSEIFVWIIAIALNVINVIFNSSIYNKTLILTLFKDIITTPFPYALIIILSCIGTFFTLYVGDEVYDVLSHKKSDLHKKHNKKIRIIFLITIIIFIIILYELMLKHLGIKIV